MLHDSADYLLDGEGWPDFKVTCVRCRATGMASTFEIDARDAWECPACYEALSILDADLAMHPPVQDS